MHYHALVCHIFALMFSPFFITGRAKRQMITDGISVIVSQNLSRLNMIMKGYSSMLILHFDNARGLASDRLQRYSTDFIHKGHFTHNGEYYTAWEKSYIISFVLYL